MFALCWASFSPILTLRDMLRLFRHVPVSRSLAKCFIQKNKYFLTFTFFVSSFILLFISFFLYLFVSFIISLLVSYFLCLPYLVAPPLNGEATYLLAVVSMCLVDSYWPSPSPSPSPAPKARFEFIHLTWLRLVLRLRFTAWAQTQTLTEVNFTPFRSMQIWYSFTQLTCNAILLTAFWY